MTGLPTCILYTQDSELSRRVNAYLRPTCQVLQEESPQRLITRLQQMNPALVMLDLFCEQARDMLVQVRIEFPESLIIALGTPRSDPFLQAEALGVYGVMSLTADKKHIQAAVSHAVDQLQLLRENRLLRNGKPAGDERDTHAGDRAAEAKAVQHLSRTVRHFENVGAMLESIVEAVAHSTRIARVGIFLKDSSSGDFVFKSGQKCLGDVQSVAVKSMDAFVLWLDLHAHMIVRTNLEHVHDLSERALLEQWLNVLGAEIIVPLHGNAGLMGWLFLGSHVAGIPLDTAQLEDLTSLVDYAAQTIENSLLHKEVRHQRKLSETLFQSMPLGIVAVGPDGIITSLNGRAKEILSLPTEKVVGRPIDILGSRLADQLRRTLQNEEIDSPREWVDPATKKYLVVETIPLGDHADEPGALALIRDRTRDRLLKKKQEQLERAAFWTELAAGMSHEIRNPLVTIKTFCQLLPNRYDDATFREEFSHLVGHEVDRLNQIIEQINDFAHPPELSFAPIDVASMIKKAVTQARKQVSLKGIRIETKLSETLPDIIGDESALAESVAHLIANSMEATEGTDSGKIVLQVAGLGNGGNGNGNGNGNGKRKKNGNGNGNGNGHLKGLSLSIRDNGRGISQDIREKIFSPFCTTKARGMGLGLPIAKRTIVDHSGEIFVESDKEGTCVTVLLPGEPDKEDA